MEYTRPKDLLIYYGWLNSFNSSSNGWNNEKVAKEMAKYDILVFGDGIQTSSHGDYSNTQVIIPRIKELNPEALIFGYVTVDQTLSNFEDKVDDWNTLQVHGIFMDEAGYDYGKTRQDFNTRVDYVHSQTYANICFTNAWNMDHIIGTANDTSYPNSTYNPGSVASNLTASDFYLLESFPINTSAYTVSNPDGYEPKADWLSRGNKACMHRNTYGISLVGCGIINDDESTGQDMFDFGFISAMMFALDGFGTSDTNYGASSASTKWWTRLDTTELGKIYTLSPSVTVDTGDGDKYWRYAENGRFMLDFSNNNQQDSTIEKW